MKNSIYLTLSNGVGKLFSMVIWLLIAKFVSPSDFAYTGYFRSTLNTISSCVNYGYTNYIIRSAACRNDNHKKLLVMIFMIFTLTLNFFIGIVLLFMAFLEWLPFDYIVVACIIYSVTITLWTQILLAADQSQKRFQSTIFYNTLLILVPAVSALALYLSGTVAFSISYAIISSLVYSIILRKVPTRSLQFKSIFLKHQQSKTRKIFLSHNVKAFRLTGIPYLASIPLLTLKWALESKFVANEAHHMGAYYIAMMVFSLCMTLLFSASQPVLVKITKNPSTQWSNENLYINILFMSVLALTISAVPIRLFNYVMPEYDAQNLKYYIGNALVLGLLLSYRQGFGRIAIASGRTRILTIENLLSFAVLMILTFLFIDTPLKLMNSLIATSVIVNILYLAWVFFLKQRIPLFSFALTHTGILLLWAKFYAEQY